MNKYSKTQTILIVLFTILNSIIFYNLFLAFYPSNNTIEENIYIRDERLSKVDEYIKEAEYSNALTELNNIITEKPLLTDAYLLWSDILMWYEDKEEALKVLNKALLNGVTDTRISIEIGNIKYSEGDWVNAMPYYFLVKNQEPNNTLALIKYIKCLILLDENEKINSLLPELKSHNTSESIFYYNLIKFSETLTDFSLLTQNDDILSDDKLSLLVKLKDLANYENVNSEELRLLNLSQFVYELLNNGYIELAKYYNKKLIDENSFFEKPNLYSASIYTQLNAAELAEPYITRCLRYNPESISCHVLLIEVYYKLHRFEDLNKSIPIAIDLISKDKQSAAFSLLLILDKYNDYENILNYIDRFHFVAPNYSKEIDYIALKASFLRLNFDSLDKYINEVENFRTILIPSEDALYLSSKELLSVYNNGSLNTDNEKLIFNLYPNSIYLYLLKYYAYSIDLKSNNTSLLQSKIDEAKYRALELDFNSVIPLEFFEIE